MCQIRCNFDRFLGAMQDIGVNHRKERFMTKEFIIILSPYNVPEVIIHSRESKGIKCSLYERLIFCRGWAI